MLMLAYVLSQFFRAFLPVLTPDLRTDLGATTQDLSLAGGLWFLTFAAMQIPVGAALDRIGPRRTTAALLALGAGGGSLVFALATGPAAIIAAMMLTAVGSSPVLMAAYVIFARSFAPALFATLASATVGVGLIGNVAGSLPLAWAVGAFGWRGTMAGLAMLTVVIAGAVWALVRDPPPAPAGPPGSMLDVLRIRALWPVFAMMFVAYAPVAGLRGIWAGPYGADVFGLDAAGIGRMTLAIGVAMIIGSFAYGPLDRWLGRRKALVLAGNLTLCGALVALAIWPAQGVVLSTALLSLVGLTGATYAIIIAHARAFVPAHLMGRGVSLTNLFAIAGAGVMQLVTGPVHQAGTGWAGTAGGYGVLFGFYALTVAAGVLAYLTAQDRTD